MSNTSSLERACKNGQHVIPIGSAGCVKCGLSSQTVTDWLGHDYQRSDIQRKDDPNH